LYLVLGMQCMGSVSIVVWPAHHVWRCCLAPPLMPWVPVYISIAGAGPAWVLAE
jgi:hypothetical protein